MDDKNINICMISDLIPPDYSGAGRQAMQLANALSKNNLQITILTQTRAKSHITKIVHPRFKPFYSSTYFTIWIATWLLKNYSKYKIIHLHGLRRHTWPAILIAKLLKKPIIFKYTLPAYESHKAIQQTRLGNIKCNIFNKINLIIALSSNLYNTLYKNEKIKNKIHYIPNGVDCNIYTLPPRNKKIAKAPYNINLSWPYNALWIVYLGGIESRKGIDSLLESWNIILNKIPNARLLLIGPDTRTSGSKYRSRLINFVHDNNLDSSVHFYGNTDRPQDLLPLADVFVLPTEAEGLPNALIEAQACGVPAVATHLEGVTTDIVDDGETGLLTPVGNATALAEAIIRILTEPAWHSPEKQALIRQRCVERFSIETVAAQYAELYRKLLEQ